MRNPLYYRAIATFVAAKSGDWQDWNTWKIIGTDGLLYSDGYIPESGNPVQTQGFTIIQEANASCLTIDNIGDILPQSYQLTVGGVDQFVNSLDQISGCTFYADLQTDSTYTETSGIVERITNKSAVGTTFPTLVSNGDFTSGNTSGWTAASSAVLSVVGGSMRVTNGATAQGGGYQDITVVSGKRYSVKVSVKNCSTNATFLVSTTAALINATLVANTDYYYTVLATTNTMRVICFVGTNTNGNYSEFDNIEVYEENSCIQPNSAKRPLKLTDSDGKKYLKFDGSDDFMYGKNNVVSGSGFTKVVTIQWDDTAALLVSCHIISSLVNNIHALSISKTNSTTCRVSEGISTQNTFDLLLTTLTGRRVTIIEAWGSGTKQLYINGVEVATSSTSTSITDESFLLGSFNNGAASTFFKGKIYEFAIYNVKLSIPDISAASILQEQKYRIPEGSYITVAGGGESVSIGQNSPISDNMSNSLAGLNYWPTLNLFRIANDINGDGYSASVTGSQVPYLCSTVYAGLSKPVLYAQTGKTLTTISAISDFGSGNWSSTGTLRYACSASIKAMLKSAGLTQLDWFTFNLGENDAIYMNGHPTYTGAIFKTELQDFITYIQSQFIGVKIILVKSMKQRNALDVEIYAAQTALINDAQFEIYQENTNVFFDTTPDTFTITNGYTRPDGQHYEKIANQAVGNAHGTIIVTNN